LFRAAVELGKEWRVDRYLRRLEALLVVADAQTTLVVSGSGDIIEPDDGVVAVGSGGSYAMPPGWRCLKHFYPFGGGDCARSAENHGGYLCLY